MADIVVTDAGIVFIVGLPIEASVSDAVSVMEGATTIYRSLEIGAFDYVFLGLPPGVASDAITVSEFNELRILLLPMVFDSVGTAEAVTGDLDTDLVGVTDSVVVVLASGLLPAGMSDSVTVSEDAAIYLLNSPAAIEVVTVTDAVSAYLSILGLSASDDVSAGESISIRLVSGFIDIDAFDSLSVVESLAMTPFPIFGLEVSVMEEVTLVDSFLVDFLRVVHVLDFPRTRGINDPV